MPILHIEHRVADYDSWKTEFDNFPAAREKTGVRRYRVLRALDDPNYIIVDLEFDTLLEAETLLAKLRVVWGKVEGSIGWRPQARILDVAETREY